MGTIQNQGSREGDLPMLTVDIIGRRLRAARARMKQRHKRIHDAVKTRKSPLPYAK